MSRPSLADFRTAYMANTELFNSHEFERAFAGFPEHFEWLSFDGTLLGRGPAAVAREFHELVKDLKAWRVDPQEFIEAGARSFLIRCVGHGTGRYSGAEPAIEWFQLWEFEGGLPVRVSEFRDRDEALAAAS
jgi:hypothetical protein